MQIIVIGTGYVGLVTGVCFADLGNDVTCIDIDEAKIEKLKQGISPIYEPGLDDLLKKNMQSNRLKFSSELTHFFNEPAIFFIAVGTPSSEDGAADLSYVCQAAQEIGRNLKHTSIIVNKSTVPVGTADKVNAIICEELTKRHIDVEYAVVSNPEFLKEGKAIQDFMQPDRVVIGVDKDYAAKAMGELYFPLLRETQKIMFMSPKDAEMTKYVANAMLATKISFMNEMALLCDALDVDVDNVRQGIGADSRIGPYFIYPGCGYGGSCFPKDVKALKYMASSVNIKADVLIAVDERNNKQKEILLEKLLAKMQNQLKDKIIAVWGLAFKPDTDDMREASSVVFIQEAIKQGAKIQAYDPIAMDAAKKMFPAEWFATKALTFCSSADTALKQADALVLVTEWSEFKAVDLKKIHASMRGNLIIDGRNIFDPETVKKLGFEYSGIGRH